MADATDSGGGVDLRVIAINGTQTAVTGDGPTLIENHPDVSPDGTRIAFDAYMPGTPDDTDIYIVSMDGGVSLLTVDTPFSDIRPRWSPDGRFLVYSSNRTGNWEILIVDVGTDANYQVTVNTVFDEANAGPPGLDALMRPWTSIRLSRGDARLQGVSMSAQEPESMPSPWPASNASCGCSRSRPACGFR